MSPSRINRMVLHGSSGVSDDGMSAAIRTGITKVNASTHLSAVVTGTVRASLSDHPGAMDPRRCLGGGYAAVRSEAERLLSLHATGQEASGQVTGRALQAAHAWPADHTEVPPLA